MGPNCINSQGHKAIVVFFLQVIKNESLLYKMFPAYPSLCGIISRVTMWSVYLFYKQWF